MSASQSPGARIHISPSIASNKHTQTSKVNRVKFVVLKMQSKSFWRVHFRISSADGDDIHAMKQHCDKVSCDKSAICGHKLVWATYTSDTNPRNGSILVNHHPICVLHYCDPYPNDSAPPDEHLTSFRCGTFPARARASRWHSPLGCCQPPASMKECQPSGSRSAKKRAIKRATNKKQFANGILPSGYLT